MNNDAKKPGYDGTYLGVLDWATLAFVLGGRLR